MKHVVSDIVDHAIANGYEPHDIQLMAYLNNWEYQYEVSTFLYFLYLKTGTPVPLTKDLNLVDQSEVTTPKKKVVYVICYEVGKGPPLTKPCDRKFLDEYPHYRYSGTLQHTPWTALQFIRDL